MKAKKNPNIPLKSKVTLLLESLSCQPLNICPKTCKDKKESGRICLVFWGTANVSLALKLSC